MAGFFESIGNFAGDVWKGAGEFTGLTDDSDQATDQYNERGVEYAGRNDAAYDPSQQAGYNQFQQGLERVGATGQAIQGQAVGQLQNGYQAPQTNLTGQVNAPAPVNAQTTGTNAQFFQSGQGQADQSRVLQNQAIGMWSGAANGTGPSVAPGMMRESAATAANAFGQAGSNANQGYQNAAIQANQGFGDAAAGQQATAQQAALDSRRATMDANANAIKTQAALAAGARGGNIGASLLQAQNNAALSTAQANTQASRAFADQMRGANEQAGAAARQASGQQQAQMANLQATAERAGMEAARAREAGDARAAQIASQEQQHAMDQITSLSNDIRSQDLQATSIGAQVDQMIQGGDIANADRLLKASGMNADMAFQAGQLSASNAIQIAQMNGDWQAANNVLQADVQRFLADMGAQMDMASIQGFADTVRMGLESGMALEEAKQNAFYQAQANGIQFDLGAVNAGNDARNTNVGIFEKGADAVGKIAGAIGLSDKRTKRIKGEVDPDDFRDAKAYLYEYDAEWKDDPRAGEGDFTGPMADDLPEGTYEEDDDGLKEVNAVRLALSLASAVGALQRKVDELEGIDDEDEFTDEDEGEDPSMRHLMSLLGGRAA